MALRTGTPAAGATVTGSFEVSRLGPDSGSESAGPGSPLAHWQLSAQPPSQWLAGQCHSAYWKLRACSGPGSNPEGHGGRSVTGGEMRDELGGLFSRLLPEGMPGAPHFMQVSSFHARCDPHRNPL